MSDFIYNQDVNDTRSIEELLDKINESINDGSFIDENNSSTTPLLADAVFQGEATDVLHHSTIAVLVNTDADSADDGLVIEFSMNGTEWHTGEMYTIFADTTKWFTPPTQAKYYRITYTNGGTDQTVFHLHAVVKKRSIKWSSHNINDPIKDEDDAELVKAVITGKKVNGEYDNVSLTNGANMKVSLEELESGISTNSNSQLNTSLYDAAGIGPAEIDNSTHSLQTIEYEHHEIHAGSHYNYCDYTAAGLVSGAITNIVIQTSNTDELVHLALEAYSATGATIELYEGATGISGGTTITPRNNNRSSTNTSNTTIILNPTITTDGTRAAGFLAGAGRNAGFADRDKENILARNTIYLARITSTAAQNRISWCMEWYEHTDKN